MNRTGEKILSNFDEIFGEGELEDLTEAFKQIDLECVAVEDSVKPPAANEEGVLSLKFKRLDKDEEAGSTSIIYSKGNWDILLMNSTSGGLYEKVVQVVPAKAQELGVETISCTVPDRDLREYLTKVFQIELLSQTQTNQLVAPVDKLKEYGDWCKAGKPIDEEPEWRRSL